MDNMFQQGFSGYSRSLQSYGNQCKVGVDHMDTTLTLDSPGFSTFIGTHRNKRKWDVVDGSDISEENFSLQLGLGRPSSSSSNSKMSSASAYTISSAKESDEVTSTDLDLTFQLNLESDSTPSPKRPAIYTEKKTETTSNFDLQLSLSTGPSASSVITSTSPVFFRHESSLEILDSVNASSPADDGSTSSRWKSGNLLLQHVSSNQPINDFALEQLGPEVAASALSPMSIIPSATPEQSTLTSRPFSHHPRHKNIIKTCLFQGCDKRARGASGLCISHGGGRRCQKEGCNKGAEGRTVYCKAHGGGRRCEFLGCMKSAEGRTDFCIAHGGGRRCGHEGCSQAARGITGFCIKHGGGRRCQHENCTRSAEGSTRLCISHGGGKRCQYPCCTKGAQGSTMFCKAHGGGKRCSFTGCNKGAEGSTPFCKAHGGGKRCIFQEDGVACPRSVHGGTLFCVRHGGGKRCAVPECPSSARGSTSYCVSHGGGRRCKHEGCKSSAQGSTDFCKLHGGGKRCSWGKMVSVSGIKGSICDRYSRSKNGLCAEHNALVQDHKVHGGGNLGPDATTQDTWLPISESVPGKAKEMNFFITNRSHERNQVINCNGSDQPQSNAGVISEGRVHGGSLMAMLASNAGELDNFGDNAGFCPPGSSQSARSLHKWI